MWSGVGEFLREVADMLLNEYERWLIGTVLLILAIGMVDAVGPHWVASSVVWLAAVPAIALGAHAAVRSRRRLAGDGRRVDAADAGAAPTRAVMPRLAFQTPRLEPVDSKQASGIVLCAAITNSRTEPGVGEKARSAVARLTWTRADGSALQEPLEGRWRAAPSSDTVDVLPNDVPYLLELALKLPGEPHFRVVGASRSYWVADGRASVTVEIHGANFPPISATYTVWSDNGGEPALRFDVAG